METNNLQTFIVAAKENSFSLAAERLYLTQPAVSKRIATLENELGARLFDRIGRRVSLTEAGREFLPRAQSILCDIDDSRRLILNLTGSVTGRLSIGTSHHIGLHRLPPVLKKFSKTYSEVQLDLQFMDSEAACRAVQTGALELGIVTLPLEPLADLKSQLIWPDPLVIVVGNEHPLVEKSPLTVQQLTELPAILPSPGTYTRQLLERSVAKAGGKLKASMTTNYLETIKMMVVVGLGWSVLPRSMLNEDLKTLTVKRITLDRRLGIVSHRARTLSNAARAMVDIVQLLR